MKTTLVLLAVLVAASLHAQDAPPAPEPEAEAPTTLGLATDMVDFIKRSYPDLDPTGAHDLFNLNFPTDAAKRHNYTTAMLQLLTIYIERGQLGTTLSKLFDQYSRGKHAAHPVFKVLYAQVVSNYPPSNQNNQADAKKLLLEAAELAPDFAYPWYLLSEMELARVKYLGAHPSDTMEAVNKALKIKPDFFQALLVKADLYLSMQPRRSEEALKVLEPMLQVAPPTADDIEQLLTMLGGAASVARMVEAAKAIAEREGVTAAIRARARMTGARGLGIQEDYDEAIRWMEMAQKDLHPTNDTERLITSYRFLSACWGAKAMKLRGSDGRVPAESRLLFNESVKQAKELQHKAVEIESTQMPVELRGREAALYITFLKGAQMQEEALVWLQKYLETTEMPALHRGLLEFELARLQQRINPQEEMQLQTFKELAGRDELEALTISLQGALDNLKRGVHFTSRASVEFFLEQLKSRDRRVVALCALLLADTVPRVEGLSVAEVAAALATRLEEEKECASDDQSQLQQKLCNALISLKDARSIARAVRLVRKLVSLTDGTRIDGNMKRVVLLLLADDFLATIPGAPAALYDFEAGQVRALASWLEKLAIAVEKKAEADAEKAKEAEKTEEAEKPEQPATPEDEKTPEPPKEAE